MPCALRQNTDTLHHITLYYTSMGILTDIGTFLIDKIRNEGFKECAKGFSLNPHTISKKCLSKLYILKVPNSHCNSLWLSLVFSSFIKRLLVG